jgi:carbamoyl-phosphate synthase large subunit
MSASQSHHCRTVVVTGVGAIIGQGIVRSLRQSRRAVRVVGIDRQPQSLGPHLCDVFYSKPACEESSPAYLAFWQDLLAKESADLVLPGLEIDLFFLNAQRKALAAVGATLGLNQAELIELAGDKWLLGLELPKAGLTPIPTVLSQDWHHCVSKLGKPPLLMKPRRGNGSRGIVRLYDQTDFQYWVNKSAGNFMIQKIVGSDDEEFTVGAFGFGDGNSLSPIIFRRRLSSTGNTLYAEVVTDPAIEQATRMLSLYFKPIGPTNYQFRKEKDAPYLLEINPRLSSSTSLRAGFGYNEAEMAIDFFLDGIRPGMPSVRQGRGWRYSEDFILR